MLHRVIDVVNNHKALTQKKLNYFRSELSNPIDSKPSELPKFTDLLESGVFKPGKSFVCLVPVKLLFSDDYYNRIIFLDLKKAMENLEFAKGFSYNHANSLVAFIRPDGTLVLTQGNHRAAMAYLTQGPDALVVVNVRVHSEQEEKKYIQVEANDFTIDNNNRKNMDQYDRFKGGYVAKDEKYTKLVDIVKPFGISIADTHKGNYKATKTFESYTYLLQGFSTDDTPNKKIAKECLSMFSKHLVETDIKGYCFVGLVLFLKSFKVRIEAISEMNPLQFSLDDFVHFVFQERRKLNGVGKLTTQEDITTSTATVKSLKFFASRWVILFNEYCAVREFKIRGKKVNGEYAIPESCDQWQDFIEDLHPVNRRMFSVDSF
jgi:hypothetical protein